MTDQRDREHDAETPDDAPRTHLSVIGAQPTLITGSRGNLRPPWAPGQSGNRDGRRTHELERRIRTVMSTPGTADCAVGVEFLWRCIRGEEPGSSGARGLRHRLHALQILLNRGWGRAPLVIESSRTETRIAFTALATLPEADLRQLAALLEKARGEAQPAEKLGDVPAHSDTVEVTPTTGNTDDEGPSAA